MKPRTTIAIAALGTIIAGCATIKTARVSYGGLVPKSCKRVGIAYWLPKVKVRLVAQKLISVQTNLDPALAAGFFGQTNAFSTNHTLVMSGTNVIDTNVTDSVAIKGAQTGMVGTILISSNWTVSGDVGANGGITNHSSQMFEIQTNVDLAVSQFQVYTNYTVTISNVVEPDPTQLYLLRLSPNILADDTYQVTIDSNGCLGAIGATNADQTPAVVIGLAQAGIQAFEIAAGGLPTTPPAPGTFSPHAEAWSKALKEPKFTYPSKIDITFDPADTNELAEAQNELARAGIKFDVSPPKVSYQAWADPPIKVNSDPIDGFLYRPAIPYRLKFSSMLKESTIGVGINTVTVLLPNEAPILRFKLDRGLFVTNSVSVAFQNGMLSSIYLHKPSEAAGFVQIPVAILKMIASMPTDLIQLKINLANSNTALAQAQQQEITNWAALTSLQQSLLQKQSQTPSTNPPAK
ncbi:MAG TPA: hypothetical protein VFE51_30645 [Verrucomicrobiae bacterium]|nr:hypothetical protein [Verrucomicrobiae bacterium]